VDVLVGISSKLISDKIRFLLDELVVESEEFFRTLNIILLSSSSCLLTIR
jgi:hypothetical protein